MGVIFKDYLETGENGDLKDVTVNTDSAIFFGTAITFNSIPCKRHDA